MVSRIIARHFDGPFVWGASDCCTCACDAFAALHGIDPMAPLRGLYDSRFGAMRVIHAHGGWRRVFDEMCAGAGLVRAGWGEGHLGLLRIEGQGMALGIGYPGGVWAGKVEGGFVTLPQAVAAWAS